MTVLATKDIRRSLLKKGFKEERSKDHVTFWFITPDDKKTPVKTKFSHGAHEIGDDLISAMAQQTRLSKREFMDLINCPLSKEEYYEILKEKGL